MANGIGFTFAHFNMLSVQLQLAGKVYAVALALIASSVRPAPIRP